MGQRIFEKLESLEEAVLSENPKSILIVTGRNSFEKSGAKGRLGKLLERKVTYFHPDSSKPDLEVVERGIKTYHEANPDFIIAIGGGKVMDSAKLIKGLSKVENPRECIIKNTGAINSGERFIAIPTTSGSGAESTPFAVAYVDGVKYSFQDDSLLPDTIVLDPSMTYALSPKDTATSGLDALAQGIESYWSTNSSEETKKISLEAIKLALKYLVPAVNNPNPENRAGMQQGANKAAIALAKAKSTGPHSVSYPMTAKFGVPHGQAVGITLGKFFKFNCEVREDNCNDKRGVSYVQNTMKEIMNIFEVKSPEEAERKWYRIMRSIGLETKPSELGIDQEGISYIVENGVNPQRMKNNPVMPSAEDIKRFLVD